MRATMVDRGLPLRADELRRLRQGKGWTQVVAAQAAGVTVRAYQRWETGARAEPNHIAALAEQFGVDPNDLIVEGYEPPKPITTPEELLAAMQQQLLSLTGAVADVALGVQALLQRSEAKPTSSRAGSKRTAAPGGSRAG